MSETVFRVEEAGKVDIGRVSMVFRVGDLAAQMRDVGGRLRAELRRTVDYLARTAATEMAGRAPVGPSGRLRASIGIRHFENQFGVRAAVRPKARYAFAVEGGFAGTVKQYMRRPPRSGVRRRQITKSLRAKAAFKGVQLVPVRDYKRSQRAHPFVRPVYEGVQETAREALQNAVARALRPG